MTDNVEPERKFLTKDDSWMKKVATKTRIVQAYLSKDPARTVRVRIAGDEAFITIKGKAPENSIETPEFEYAIPVAEADALLKLCLPGTISKVRHEVPFGGKTWEVDVFDGDNEGLVVAEIELEHGAESFDMPPWAGEEVTFDARYKNSSLSSHPFTSWTSKKSKAPRAP